MSAKHSAQYLGQAPPSLPPAPLFDALDPPTQWLPVVEPPGRDEVAAASVAPAERPARFVERPEAGEPNGNDLFDSTALPPVDRRRPELNIPIPWWLHVRRWSSEVLQVAFGAALGCLLVLGSLVLLTLLGR